MQDRCKPLLDRGSGRGDCEALQGCELQKERAAPQRNEGMKKKSVRGVLWYSQQPLPSGGFIMPIRSHRRPSPLTGWQGGGWRSVTGLGNEPGEQPVGGDDGWMSHQVYSCDTRTLKHTR